MNLELIDPERAETTMTLAERWLAQLAAQFKPGTRVTIMATMPGVAGTDFLISTDTFEGMHALIDRVEAAQGAEDDEPAPDETGRTYDASSPERRSAIRELAGQLDPGCWMSYSGQPREIKRAVETRRQRALAEAARRIDGGAR